MNAWNWSHSNNRHSYRRIVAAITILTMLLACLISDLLPNTTYADALQDGDTCEPTQVTIGELDTNTSNPDTGIATFVGGNMYIGKPKDFNKKDYASGTEDNSSKPMTAENQGFSSSYAVEAEGATLVAGKMISSSLKRSWDSHGFRFGTVGFGANFRPAAGSTSLAIGGDGDLQLKDRIPNETSVLAYGLDIKKEIAKDTYEHRTTAAGWTGIYDSNDAGPSYNMQINNKTIRAWPAIKDTKNAALETYTDTESYINWDSTNALANVTIQGSSRTDYTNFLEDTVRKDSTLLAQQKQKEGASVTIETAQYATEGKIGSPSVSDEGQIVNGVFQTKYNKFNNDDRVPTYPVQYDNKYDSNTDRLITFTGTQSDTEVFEISGNDLNVAENAYVGTAFNFTNVKDDARIVVNVTGDAPITFRNSWRFFWNDKDISKGYNNAAIPEKKTAYSRAASHITWNFTNTSYLTILGGTSAYNYDERKPEDDPAAAMLGSIYVPYGSFESHVTTNGRVYVGGDFMMYNPTQVANFTELEGPSASIIDMDQERHNFPGGFSSMSQCSSIAWKKIDESGNPLGNTTWAVYGSLEQAKAHDTATALWQVQDNIVGKAGDLDPENGSFKVSNLKPNRSYYIREIATNNNQYDLNTNIYQINTGAGGEIYSTIEDVYTKDGNNITNTNDILLANTGIINKAKSTGLEWGKTNAIPESGEPTGLPDSEWILSKKDTAKQWLITDESADITDITITPNEGSPNDGGTLQLGTSATYSSAVTPNNAIQKVTWSVTPSAGVTLVATDTTATITVNDANLCGQQVTLTATGADGNTTESITVTITLPEIQNISITPTNPTVHVGNTITLNAEIKDTNNNILNVQPTWTSNNSNIATINNQGVVTGKKEGTVTITASIKNMTVPVTVIVTDGIVFYATVPQSWETAYVYAWNGENKLAADSSDKPVAMEKIENGKYKYRLYNTLNGTTYDSFNVIIAKTEKWDDKSADSPITLTNGIYEYSLNHKGYMQYMEITPIQASSLSRRSPAHYSQAEDTWAHIDTSSFTSEQILQDLNPSVGKFKIDLPDGDGTYTLQENKAPDRYFINTQIYTITVENGTITWDPEPEQHNRLHWITDTPNAFSWNKVDAGYLGDDTNGNNPLAGSQWTLQKFTDGEYKNNVYIDDCVSDSQEGCTNKQDTDSRDGFFKIEKLPAGLYRLVEKQAPIGFTTDTTTHYYFEITQTDTKVSQWTVATSAYDSATGSPTAALSNGGGDYKYSWQ